MSTRLLAALVFAGLVLLAAAPVAQHGIPRADPTALAAVLLPALGLAWAAGTLTLARRTRPRQP